MPLNIEIVRSIIEDALPGATVYLTDLAGDNDHYQAVVEASQFKGLSMVDQHKMVYNAFGDLIGKELHALVLTTKIKEC